MLNRNVLTQVCNIAETPSAEILLANLKEMFEAKEAEKLIDVAFKQSGNRQDIDVIVDDEERSYAVENRGGTLSYFQPNSARWYPADVDKLKVYKVSFDWLLNAVMSAFGIESMKPVCILEEKIWFIGSAWLKKRKTPIILVRNISKQEVLEKLDEYLKEKHKSQPALIITTANNIPAYFKPHSQNRIVMMNNAVDPESDNLVFNVQYLSDKMGGYIEKEGFSNGYRTARFNGIDYKFTKVQAEILEEIDRSNGAVHKHELMPETSSSQDDPKGVFRKNGKYHPAWNIIIKNDNEGNYWLEY